MPVLPRDNSQEGLRLSLDDILDRILPSQRSIKTHPDGSLIVTSHFRHSPERGLPAARDRSSEDALDQAFPRLSKRTIKSRWDGSVIITEYARRRSRSPERRRPVARNRSPAPEVGSRQGSTSSIEGESPSTVDEKAGPVQANSIRDGSVTAIDHVRQGSPVARDRSPAPEVESYQGRPIKAESPDIVDETVLVQPNPDADA